MEKLEIKNLTKQFGDETAVDNLSLSIEDGKLKSLLGPSGCGKTTTLRCVAGLETPTSGEIYIDGELVSAPEQGINVGPEARGIGMVFQNYAIWPHMTVEENVMFPLRHLDIGTKADRNDRVEEILDVVDLRDQADALAPHLSGGQQQRVALARALVSEPELLLLDEPLSNLDAKLRKDMRHEIRRICDELGVTMLYVTHSQDEALFISDEVSIMNDGHLVEEGPPHTIHEDPRSFFGMTFLGQCNVLNGRIEGVEDGVASVKTDVGSILSSNLVDTVSVDEQVYACFRPKMCDISPDANSLPTGDGIVRLEGTLTDAATTTDFFEYYVDVGGTSIQVRSPDAIGASPGTGVHLALDAKDVKVFSQDRVSEGESMSSEEHVARMTAD